MDSSVWPSAPERRPGHQDRSERDRVAARRDREAGAEHQRPALHVPVPGHGGGGSGEERRVAARLWNSLRLSLPGVTSVVWFWSFLSGRDGEPDRKEHYGIVRLRGESEDQHWEGRHLSSESTKGNGPLSPQSGRSRLHHQPETMSLHPQRGPCCRKAALHSLKYLLCRND